MVVMFLYFFSHQTNNKRLHGHLLFTESAATLLLYVPSSYSCTCLNLVTVPAAIFLLTCRHLITLP